jgi:hypothetical protein
VALESALGFVADHLPETHLHANRLLCAALVILPLSTALAQSPVLPPQRFGITAGINSSTISGGDDGTDVSRRTGFMAGVFMVVPVTPTFSAQPEALFTMKGAKAEDAGFSATVKINYLEIPILGRFDIPATGGVKPFVYAGPAIAFKLSCSSEAHGAGISVSGDCKDTNGDDAKTFDFSGVIGGGLAFAVGGRAFTIGARYTHGFSNIGEGSDSKNRTISALVSLEFPWPK